jgi:hypothetical protein
MVRVLLINCQLKKLKRSAKYHQDIKFYDFYEYFILISCSIKLKIYDLNYFYIISQSERVLCIATLFLLFFYFGFKI